MQPQAIQFALSRRRIIGHLILLPVISIIWLTGILQEIAAVSPTTRPATFANNDTSETVSVTHIISGQVTFAHNGSGVEGATIYANGKYSATTNTSGFYAITGVITGTYTLTGAKESGSPYTQFRFEPFSRSVTVPPNAGGQNFSVGILAVDYGLFGLITDPKGSPLAGVTIAGGGLPVETTDENGSFGWFPIAVGTYTLTPQKNGYLFTPPSATVTVPLTTSVKFTGTAQFRQQFLPIVVQSK